MGAERGRRFIGGKLTGHPNSGGSNIRMGKKAKEKNSPGKKERKRIMGGPVVEGRQRVRSGLMGE